MFTKEDYQEIKNHFQTADPVIAQLLKQMGYCQPPPPRNLFSLVVGAILGQKIRFRTARELRRRLYVRLGTDNFTPDQVLDLGLTGLLDLEISEPISKLILTVATLGEPENMTAVEKLREIKGIGDWTIRNVRLMWSLNESSGENNKSEGTEKSNFLPASDQADYLLTSDLIIRRGMKSLYGATSESERQSIASRWIPYRGIVTWYLWKAFS